MSRLINGCHELIKTSPPTQIATEYNKWTEKYKNPNSQEVDLFTMCKRRQGVEPGTKKKIWGLIGTLKEACEWTNEL